MLDPTDREYKSTKMIKHGRAAISDKFVSLAEWIAERFDCVAPLNIVSDKTFMGVPRLQIIFDYEADAEKFLGADGIQYDEEKQQIVMEQFKKTVPRSRFFGLDYTRMFAIFPSFERVAREEANYAMRESEIAAVELLLASPMLWTIKPSFACATFMLYTDDQLKTTEDTAFRRRCVEAYSRELAPYDEFGYFAKRPIDVTFSSKETFERDYESSWFYFFK